ncbi:hypothetical protein [Asticcacaulis solisilvae]|uniref:hypothetical protein n=1 Tax=Asticcacaulis solisilvae TaxID=1217274 RepID=UPI003FD6D45F
MRTLSRSLLSIAAAALLIGVVPAVAPSYAHAEGTESDTPVKAKHRKARHKKTPVPAPKPAGPVPYSTLAPPAPAQPVHPGPPAVATTPDALPQPAETSKPIPPASDVAVAPRASLPAPPPPPPPPPSAVPNVAPTVSAPAEISLKCETEVLAGSRVVSHGVFFIDLFPSAVFPDQHADFKFSFVDPSHGSLIRDSICLDAMCPANVTGSAYYLVNQVTKKGNALRITLDRSRGAFYAEEIDHGFMGFRSNAEHRGERGYCTPQPLPGRMF